MVEASVMKELNIHVIVLQALTPLVPGVHEKVTHT